MNGLIQALEINLDLNEPLDDNLGGIEDLLHAAENLDEQPPFRPQPEDIIIEDINSDMMTRLSLSMNQSMWKSSYL